PLIIHDLLGISATGQVITNGAAYDGEVVLVNREPVLTTRQTPNGTMKLFGQPGGRYRVESTPELGPSAQWLPLEEFTLTERARVLPLISDKSARFYRVLELGE